MEINQISDTVEKVVAPEIEGNAWLKAAHGHFREIINLTDHRDLRKDLKQACRDNVASLLEIITLQNIEIAKLQGRLMEREEFAPNKHLSYADKVKIKNSNSNTSKTTNSRDRSKSAIRNKTVKKYISTVKPKEESSSSSSIVTRKVVQSKLDVRHFKIGVKHVRNIRNGGILIETEDTLLLENLNLQFDDPQDPTDKFQIKHHFASKRGVNWIVEVNPAIYQKVASSRNSRAANIQLGQTILCEDFDYLSLNEPYTFENVITAVPLQYKIIAHPFKPRAAILIKRGFSQGIN
ncbi:hypothetical protein CEXT_272111 [Caerostris extrusa]|uniref:Uncharacterized protein n=1 Tax=Caerostris extrusa TaxID=172846 RepID=A0AAV4NYD4_CAEEX|nr:hypothetical protein CEXT_272111 [Caerostris extrusa]